MERSAATSTGVLDKMGRHFASNPYLTFYAICPVCLFRHADDDSGPGVSDGTFEQMQAERQKWEERTRV